MDLILDFKGETARREKEIKDRKEELIEQESKELGKTDI